jgi:hypothetical protein
MEEGVSIRHMLRLQSKEPPPQAVAPPKENSLGVGSSRPQTPAGDSSPAPAWDKPALFPQAPVLAAIILLATTLRIAWPTLTEFKFSEARLAALALNLTQRGDLPLVGVPSSAGFDHSPISVYLYAPAFLLTANPLPATIYGGLVGVAAVLLCYKEARRWPQGSRAAASIAALLLAAGPWPVAFSRKIWQVTFIPVLTLACVSLLTSALVERRQRNLIWSLGVYALLIQVHPSAISLAPALVLWLVVFWREVRLTHVLAGGLLGAVSAGPFLLHQLRDGWPVLRALTSLPAAEWDLSAIRLAWEVITGRGIHALAGDASPQLAVVPELSRSFNLLGWLLVSATAWLTWCAASHWRAEDTRQRAQARIDLVLVSWLVIPVLFNLRHSLELHWHFFALVAPAACLVIGRATSTWLLSARMLGVRVLLTAGMGLLMALQIIALALMARFVASHDTPRGFGTPLRDYLSVADQALAAAAREGSTEILVVGEGDSAIVDEQPAIFDVLLRERASCRFVDGESAALFPPLPALALLTPGAGDASEWYHAYPRTSLPEGYQLVTLDGSSPSEGLLPVSGPRLFQNGIEIQNYGSELNVMGQGNMRIWLLWQVLWLHSDPTHFSVRCLDIAGQPCGQKDSVGYTVAYRRKGDRILSKFDITPRPGPGPAPKPERIEILLYVYPELTNVPVVDPAGSPVAGSLTLDVPDRGQ